MPDLPLLVFPTPQRSMRANLTGGGGNLAYPPHRQQADRLAPQFVRLQQALDQKRLTLQGAPGGIEPEQVLVLEIVGAIENFVNAVRRLPTVEWLGEFDLDDLPPAHGFADAKKPSKPLKVHVFLVMTDQKAMRQLRSLFDQWQADPQFSFPEGMTPLRDLFQQLSAIRPWGPEDRIRETGLFDDWQERIASGQSTVPFEIEFWHRNKPDRRHQAETLLEQAIVALGGSILKRCTIDEIRYHAVLGTIPTPAVPDLAQATQDPGIFSLVRYDDVMYLRPIGQCITVMPDDDGAPLTQISPDMDRPAPGDATPLIALLDGLPMTGHRLLTNRLLVDDPDNWEQGYLATARRHGTAMASVICHGDLTAAEAPLARKVYTRPILKPMAGHPQQPEHIPDEVLPVDLVHRAVSRLFDGEAGEEPVAPTVRVINLSIGDSRHPFARTMSAWARLLDWLAWKYQVLFIVSAGNHVAPLTISMDRLAFMALSPIDREQSVIQAVFQATRHRRLLSPAETINGVTVGAVHADSGPIPAHEAATMIDPLPGLGRAACYAAHGLGLNRTIKPDLMFPGGRMLVKEQILYTAGATVLEKHQFQRPPGIQHAAPGAPGQVNNTIHARGTSHAAALASRAADRLYTMLQGLRQQPGVSLPTTHDAVLLKALLTHGACWGEAGAVYRKALLPGSSKKAVKLQIARFLGYGQVDVERVLRCTTERATILGIGALDDKRADSYHLPLPPSLSARRVRRRLTVTLAWLTPIAADTQRYRKAHLWFAGNPRIASKRQESDDRAVQRGTVQHEIFEDRKVLDFTDGEVLQIQVNCRAVVGDLPRPVPYALVVTLEETEGLGLPVYNEIRDRLRLRVRADEEEAG